MSSPQNRRNTIRLFREINGRQAIAILFPLLLVGVMIPVFRLLSGAFENAIIGWYLGLVSYWLTWCTIVPLWLVGKQRLKQIIRPHKPDLTVVLLVLFPTGSSTESSGRVSGSPSGITLRGRSPPTRIHWR